MSDPTPRRRLTAKLLLGSAILALPLTASISYASVEQQDANTASQTPPERPVAPQPPQSVPGPDAPTIPMPPVPPSPPTSPGFNAAFAETAGNYRQDVANAGRAMQQAQRDMERAERDMERAEEAMERAERDVDSVSFKNATHGKDGHRHKVERRIDRHTHNGKTVERKFTIIDGKTITYGDYNDAEVREAFRDAQVELKFVKRQLAKGGEIDREIKAALAQVERTNTAVRVDMTCINDEPVSETTDADGTTVVRICTSQITADAMRQARRGLSEARAAIAADRDISAANREEVLRSIDRQLAQTRAST